MQLYWNPAIKYRYVNLIRFIDIFTFMVKELLEKNRSYRRFCNKEHIDSALLKKWAGYSRLCASGRNIQALKYITVSDPCICDGIYGNLKWAGYFPDWDGPVEEERPSAYIIQMLDTSIAGNVLCDDGLHIEAITLGAVEDGYGCCIIKSFNAEKIGRLLDLPEHLSIRYVIALGKPVEEVFIEEMKDGEFKYWRDENGGHHVPKRSTEELIFKSL